MGQGIHRASSLSLIYYVIELFVEGSILIHDMTMDVYRLNCLCIVTIYRGGLDDKLSWCVAYLCTVEQVWDVEDYRCMLTIHPFVHGVAGEFCSSSYCPRTDSLALFGDILAILKVKKLVIFTHELPFYTQTERFVMM